MANGNRFKSADNAAERARRRAEDIRADSYKTTGSATDLGEYRGEDLNDTPESDRMQPRSFDAAQSNKMVSD